MPNRYLLPTAILLACYVIGPPALRADDQSTAGAKPSCVGCEKCSRQGPWFVVETANFQACCLDSQATAKLLATTAEKYRSDLQSKWLGDNSQQSWSSKCQIVLHPNLDSYVAACGPGSEHTVGSSLIKTEENQIAGRRIDLLAAGNDFLSAALPHELTHVILKDRFHASPMPRWADEGAAVLADTDAKQGRHHHDLESALAQHKTFEAARLLMLDDYPRPDQVGTFYGQSASVVEFLVDKGKPALFVDFVELASSKGYDAALRQCYSITDVRELDRVWRQHVSQAMNAQTPAPASGILAAR